MNPENWSQLVMVLLGATLLAGLAGWSRFGREIFPPVSVALLMAAAVLAALPAEMGDSRAGTVILTGLAGAVALAGGGPVTTWVFGIVDRGHPEGPTIDSAGSILRGGSWIGGLERLAVYACLVGGFPEGLAIVLGLKGLGRFPDLRADAGLQATTERFIIGTSTSLLWAAASAGVVAQALR